jgi:Bacterial mobilisation protein (MobC)
VARPRQAVVREKKLTMRLTEAELQSLLLCAAKSGQTLTEYGRCRLLTGKAAKAKAAPRPFLDPDVWTQIRRIGVNLNQIAHRLNADRHPAPPTLEPLLKDIRQLLSRKLAPP